MKQKTLKIESADIQTVLENEFAKLQTLIPFDGVTAVRWKPESRGKLSGEVVDSVIYVYEENLNTAVNTLKHEYLDCILTRKIINPLTAIVNIFIEDKTRQIYREKERIVECLLKLSRT
jgi:hypothetical protein